MEYFGEPGREGEAFAKPRGNSATFWMMWEKRENQNSAGKKRTKHEGRDPFHVFHVSLSLPFLSNLISTSCHRLCRLSLFHNGFYLSTISCTSTCMYIQQQLCLARTGSNEDALGHAVKERGLICMYTKSLSLNTHQPCPLLQTSQTDEEILLPLSPTQTARHVHSSVSGSMV